MTERTCTTCGITKPTDEFYRYPTGSSHSRCKACNNAASVAWGKANPEQKNANERRRRAESDATRERERRYYANNRELVLAKNRRYIEANPDVERRIKLRRFGMTLDDYEAMLVAQGGVCAVCQQPETRTTRSGRVMALAIDHDHRCCPGDGSCGRCIRALLCANCNQAAGLLGEDAERIRQLADYLDKWRPVPPPTDI